MYTTRYVQRPQIKACRQNTYIKYSVSHSARYVATKDKALKVHGKLMHASLYYFIL